MRQASRQIVLTSDNIGQTRALLSFGSSKGDYEAIELRGGDENQYDDYGVLQAAENVRSVLGVGLTTRYFDVATQ